MKDSKSSIPKMSRYLKVSPKSDNTVSTGKLANEVTSFEVNSPCLQHLSQCITHFCENCEYRPLCGLCLQEGGHRDHSVKNSEKISKIVHRVLTETLIRIRAKVNLLEVLGEHIELRQNQITNELKDYIINVNESFDSLQSCLGAKKRKAISIVESFYKIECEKLQQAEKSAEEQKDKLNQMINILSQKAQKLDQNSLCIFYYQKKEILQGTLEEGNSIYEDIKKLVPQLRWSLNPNLFQQFKEQINSINVIFDHSHIEIVSNDLLRKKIQPKQKSLFRERKSQKFINFNNTGFWTPKNIESSKFSKKNTKDMKDSKKLLTLLSSESAQKTNFKSIETPNMPLKKGKNKIKFEKNY